MGNDKKLIEGPFIMAVSCLLLCAVIGCAPSPTPDGSSALPDRLWGINLDRPDPVGEVGLAHFRSEDLVLEIQAIRTTEAAARSLASERSRVFASLFEIKRTGYPGQQTTFVDCPQEFQPSRVERDVSGGGFLDAWTSWSNSNRIPGACSADLAQHRTVIAHLFCPSSKMFLRVDWSVPNKEGANQRAADFISQLACDSL